MMGLGMTSPRAYLPLLFFEIGLPGGLRAGAQRSGYSCGGMRLDELEGDESPDSVGHQLLSLWHPAG